MLDILIVEGVGLGIIGIIGFLTYPRFSKPSYLEVIYNWVGNHLNRSKRISLRYVSLKLIQRVKDDYFYEVEAERQYRIKKYKNNSFMDANDIWIINFTKDKRAKLTQLMVRIFNNKSGIDLEDLDQLNSVTDDIFRALEINKEHRRDND